MVTAASPVIPDSHALPPASAALPGSSPAASFQSIYQSLPLLAGDSQSAADSQLPSAKDPVAKKSPAKGANDTLPATANVALVADSPPQRPWIPAPSTFPAARVSFTEQPASAVPATSASTPSPTRTVTNAGEHSSTSTHPQESDPIDPVASATRLFRPMQSPTSAPEPVSNAPHLTNNPAPVTSAKPLQQNTAPSQTAPLRPSTPVRPSMPLTQSTPPQQPAPLQLSAAVQHSNSLPAYPALQQPAPPQPSISPRPSAPPPSAPPQLVASLQPSDLLPTGASQQALPSTTPEREPAFNPTSVSTTPSMTIGAPIIGSNLITPNMIGPTVTAPLTQSRTSAANTAAGAGQLEQDPPKSPSNGSSTGTGVNQSLINKEVNSALPPRTENLAFSLRLLDSDSAALAHRVPATSQPATAQAQPSNQTRGQTQGQTQTQAQMKTDARTGTPAATVPPASTVTRAAAPAPTPAEAAPGTANPAWSEAAATQHVDLRPEIPLADPQAPANPSTVAAMHDAQPVLPETARPNTTGEILLQLGGKDQPAAIRVTDRAGAINVSVHATDPDLRSSLRSNLGDLASQLSHQGWKTEV